MSGPGSRAAAVSRLMRCAAAKVAVSGNHEAVLLADVLPQRWAQFIRDAPMADVRPLGTRTSQQGASKWGAAGRSQQGTTGAPPPQLNRDYGP